MTHPRVCVFLLACLIVGPSDAFAGTLRLNSGKTVDVLSMGPMFGTSWSALQLVYQTAMPVNNEPQLRMEADELWDRFVVDVVHGGYSSAIVTARSPASGMIIHVSQQYNFVFERKNGTWHSLEAKERTRLDKSFVASFMERLESADMNHEPNALSLYIADDFVMRSTSKVAAVAFPPTLSREQFIASEMAGWKVVKNFHEQQKILGISISPSQTIATVEHRDTNQADFQGQHIVTAAHFKDVVELRGRYMLWTKSEMVLESQSQVRQQATTTR